MIGTNRDPRTTDTKDLSARSSSSPTTLTRRPWGARRWDGAPEVIRALISGPVQLGPAPADVYVAEWS